MILKNNNKRELQNNAISHSADIDYNDFVKIYKEPFSFLTTDTLPGKWSFKIQKKIVSFL